MLKTGEGNPYWNCNCGPTSGNGAMSQHQFAKCSEWVLLLMGMYSLNNVFVYYCADGICTRDWGNHYSCSWFCGFLSIITIEKRPVHEHGKGWGLITINRVSKGNTIQDYIGEIIDRWTKNDCLLNWYCNHPNNPNFCAMRFERGWNVDAREVANSAQCLCQLMLRAICVF
jgi:hypothetical protein